MIGMEFLSIPQKVKKIVSAHLDDEHLLIKNEDLHSL